MENKKCKSCKEIKELTCFHKNKGMKDGHLNKCKDCVSNYMKTSIDKEKKKEINAKYYKENKHIYTEYNKKYNKKNKNAINENRKKYIANKRKTNALFRTKDNLRAQIRNILYRKLILKDSTTEKILGCTYEEFMLHLESKFESWMTWDNQGNPKDGVLKPNKSWDIDHIIPLSTAITKEEVYELCNYTNLQPLCSYNNRYIKRDKV